MNQLASKEMSANDTQSIPDGPNAVKILVVDDKPNIVKQLSEIFSKNEWHIQSTPMRQELFKNLRETTSFSAIFNQHGPIRETAVDFKKKTKNQPQCT